MVKGGLGPGFFVGFNDKVSRVLWGLGLENPVCLGFFGVLELFGFNYRVSRVFIGVCRVDGVYRVYRVWGCFDWGLRGGWGREWGRPLRQEVALNLMNPLNPKTPLNPKNPLTPINPINPKNPLNPKSPLNPNNPINPINPKNPLNPSR